MENGFVSNSGQWSSRSGVLQGMGGAHMPNGGSAPADNGRYLSPKEAHSDMQQQRSPFSAANGNPLLGVDLPNHMFMQAVNFENQGGQGDYHHVEQMEANTRASAHNGSLNMSDNQMDLFEQQQAKEQAKLLQRFKELRQMQLQQQQLLMHQQQSQLMALKSEQSRVQEMITKQRQDQWGGKVMKAPMSDGSPFISPRKRPVDITQALANGMISQYQHMHDLVDNKVNQTNSQAGLPRPLIPDTDSEGGCHTNPELYSNPGSVDSRFSEDLIPLVNQPSEDGDFIHQSQSHLQSWPPREVNPDSADEEDDLESDYVPPSRRHLQAQTWPQRDITEAASKHTHSEGFETDEGIGTQSFHNSPAGPQPPRHATMETRPHSQSEDEEGDDTLQRSCVEVYEEDIHPDDRPVSSVVVGKKTFEELLEEQLRVEEEKLLQSPSVENKPTKKAFLKRGKGLERFKAPPKKREIIQPVKKATQNKKTETQVVVASRKLTGTGKTGISSGPKSTQGNSVQHKSKADSDSNVVKKTLPALKSGHGQTGIPQKSLKLRSMAQKSAMATNNKIEVQGVTSSSDNVNNNQKYSKAEKPNTEESKEPKSIDVVAEPLTNNSLQSNQNSIRRSVDSSFLSHLVKLGANQQVEEEDLEEFEMLEHFADNASFSSNSSLVVKVLQKDRLKAAQLNSNGLTVAPHGHLINKMADHMRFFKPPALPGSSDVGSGLSPPRVNIGEDSSDSDSSSSESSDSEDNGLLSTLKRRDLLSDNKNDKKSDANVQTNIDPENPGIFWKPRNDGSNSDSDIEAKQNKHEIEEPASKIKSNFEVINSPVKRKIAGRDGAQLTSSALQSEIDSQKYKLHLQQNQYDSDSDSLSTSSDEEVDKEHYSDNQSGDRNSNYPKTSPGIEVDFRNNEGKVEEEDKFDDEDEWGETSVKKTDVRSDSSSDSEVNDTLIEEQKDKKQSKSTDIGTSPKRSHSNADSTKAEPSPPPTSKLMTKLFPKLKPKTPVQTQAQLEKLRMSREAPVNDGIQSKLLREKLAELEAEINKFRAENSNLDRLRKEREEGLSKLKKEIVDFEKEKNEELQRLNEFKTQEMKKLKHEKKVFEKYQKAARAMPDKKEREEMETLRSQLTDLQEELKRKESRWSMNTTRLKSRLEEMEQENVELKAEIRILEKKRLEWLQKEQASKAAGRHLSHHSTPAEQTPPSNGHQFIHTDSEEEQEPVRGDQKRLTRHPSANGVTLKPENKRHDKVSPRAHQKHERSNSTNQRPKSARPSTNQMSDKSNSPSKSSNHKARPSSAKLLNSNRMSLTEDLPRRQFNAEAIPQQAPLSSSGANTTQQSRKLAARFNVDKSSIDKGGDFEEIQHPDGKVERIYNTGAREILFSNGTRKEISSDGQSIIVSFFNGDIKQIMADQRVVYYYSEAQTTHSTYPDGLEILQFPNNQVEKHYPDGTKEITFPDQTIKYLFPSGIEESVFTDGTVIRVDKTGDKTIEFPNGQREIHTQQFKKREYPDGTVKTVFPDGRQETRYSNGRIRVKDREGNVVMDKRS